MTDVDLIRQCAGPRLEAAVVQLFVAEMNALDHPTIRAFQPDRMILVPAPNSAEDAIETARQWVGKANGRVGLTQYPAGLGTTDAAEIGLELFDTCENPRPGTELFGKVPRIGGKREEGDEASGFQKAAEAYLTGWFVRKQVFHTGDPQHARSIELLSRERPPQAQRRQQHSCRVDRPQSRSATPPDVNPADRPDIRAKYRR